LVEQGADLHAQNDYALRLAAENGHLKVVKYLLEQGANLHADNEKALRLAALYGHLEVVKYLLEEEPIIAQMMTGHSDGLHEKAIWR